MAKRLWIAVLIAAAVVACKSSKKDDKGGTSKIESGKTATASVGESLAEKALRDLGIDGAVSTLDLNQATYRDGPLNIAALHPLREYVLAEGSGEKPRVVGIKRSNLNATWISYLPEPSIYNVGENWDTALFVSKHYITPLDLIDGRRSFRLPNSEIRAPAKPLPFTPTGGAAAQSDTVYIPSLGSSVNNKKLESFSLVSGQRGWGWRALGDVVTTPLVGGPSGDPKLYFVTNTGIATCLDARNYGFGPQEPRWESRLSDGVAEGHQPFLTSDTTNIVGAYYIVDRRGTIYCIDRITGRRRWTNTTGEVPTAGPMVFGDVCVVPMRSGLMAFDKENVVYRVEVVAGPSKGASATVRAGKAVTVGSGGTDLVVSDPKVAKVHLTLRVQGEILSVMATEDASMRIDGADIGKRSTVENGTEIAIGGSVLRITDVGKRPLWKGLKYDRIVVRIGDKLIAAKGMKMQAIDAYTGEPAGEMVAPPGARAIPSNPWDSVLVVLTGNATLHALYPR
ncbi:MAG: outer membrane protein assembly factor BamB family protein [Planctomycetota bacterium]|jgi:hypothetical protein